MYNKYRLSTLVDNLWPLDCQSSSNSLIFNAIEFVASTSQQLVRIAIYK